MLVRRRQPLTVRNPRKMSSSSPHRPTRVGGSSCGATVNRWGRRAIAGALGTICPLVMGASKIINESVDTVELRWYWA
jgi:hypothetical protein